MRRAHRRYLVVLAVIITVALLLSMTAECLAGGDHTWLWQNPLPDGLDLFSVSAADANNVWAVGAGGVILHYDGSTLTRQQSNTVYDLYCVSALDANHVWAVGEEGTIVFYNGSSWTVQASGTPYDLSGVSAADTTHIWAVGSRDFADATILFCNGSSWQVQQTYSSGGLFDVSAFNNRRVWAVDCWTLFYNGSNWSIRNDGSTRMPYVVSAYHNRRAYSIDWDGTVLYSPDRGTTWNPQWIDYWPANLYALDGSNVWVVGWDGNISYYDGSSWNAQASGVTDDLYDVCAVDANNAWAVGPGNFLYYDGSTWTGLGGGVTRNLFGVDAYSQDIVAAVGRNGTFAYTVNGGTVWNTMATGTTEHLRSLSIQDTSHVWTVGNGGTIRFFNGSTWAGQTSGTTQNLLGVEAYTQSIVAAVGLSGTFIYTLNGGAVWNSMSTGTTNSLRGISLLDTSHIWVVGDGGTIRFFNGSTWAGQASGTTRRLRGVSAVDASHVWAVGNSGTILFYNGSTWSTQTSGTTERLNGVSAVDASHVWAVGENGTVLFFDGTAWSAQDSTATVGLNGVSAFDASNCWAVGDGGTILYADPPFIKYCDPCWGDSGDSLNVRVVGAYTHFNGTSVVDLGEGITIDHGSLQILGSGVLTVDIEIDPGAARGPRDVSVVTGDEAAVPLSGGFVVDPDPRITTATPSAGDKGWTGDVRIEGGETHFDLDSRPTLGEGVVVNYITEVLPDSVVANVTIEPDAAVGARGVNVVTGAETPRALSGGFTVGYPPGSVWYLAEGTSAWGFNTYLTIMNPNDEEVTAEITYMTPDGPVEREPLTLPAASQTSISPAADLPFETDFSTKVVSPDGKTIAVDRTMWWTGEGAPSPDGHCSIGVKAPSVTWYLPEGCSAYGFETWLLIQNPNGTEATCTVTYMTQDWGASAFDVQIPANSRRTFNMVDDIGSRNASIRVESDLPVIAERSMYRDNRREGHDSIGATSPAIEYYLAEGTTNHGFDTYMLIQNPNDSMTQVTVTYMTPEGPVPRVPFNMPANSRQTIRVNDILPGTDFSTRVSADMPIVAERAMYWGEGTTLGEATHDTVGLAEPHDTFYLPDGKTAEGYETYTLVQNPNDTDVRVEITYLTPAGDGNVTFTATIPAGSRATFNMADEIPDGQAAIMVTSKTDGKKIIAERAMYWNDRGAGTCTIGGYVP